MGGHGAVRWLSCAYVAAACATCTLTRGSHGIVLLYRSRGDREPPHSFRGSSRIAWLPRKRLPSPWLAAARVLAVRLIAVATLCLFLHRSGAASARAAATVDRRQGHFGGGRYR